LFKGKRLGLYLHDARLQNGENHPISLNSALDKEQKKP